MIPIDCDQRPSAKAGDSLALYDVIMEFGG